MCKYLIELNRLREASEKAIEVINDRTTLKQLADLLFAKKYSIGFYQLIAKSFTILSIR